ncbi:MULTISPECIES: beta-ketoacyl-[acyl-carrier-protein] synthase family protein [unclassified Photorhabdus]|uniref:beta-ketoacyl-[acyl-carrier-protein] synthase family protein n=1 Tax=unclassified Photorhabdus TaxID=2620880 RepID=UPI000DCF20C1|nr:MULTISPECIES: beta-ketoacyl-[acyl-carrier-protein] synthase family protein [unclassified Photorhabdus]RAW93240.1 beta-ketoacyl synthase [Photorhabdus sp. S9-53]RAW93312.1 beta-ketoacyl synthase [Photorhabdus sp. S10-54]RAW96799.1 beta-ketoacyl synthase [Photorhabdus sp. S8-52]
MKKGSHHDPLCISAYGAVTPLGNTLEEIYYHLKNNISGIKTIEKFDHHALNSPYAGIPREGNRFISWPKKNRFRNGELFYVEKAATELASRLTLSTYYLPDEIGCIIGADEPAIDVEQCIAFTQKLPHSVNREYLVKMAVEHFKISDLLDLDSGAVLKSIHNIIPYSGVSFAHLGLCSASTQSVGLAMRAIHSGQVQAVIAGGVSAKVTPVNLARLEGMGVITTDKRYTVEQRSRPFDRNRSGFVLAEGGVLFVIEKESAVRARKGTPLALLLGYGGSLCAENIVVPHHDDLEMRLSMERALENAGIAKNCIDFVSAHGTSTVQNDIHESRAITRVFGEHQPAVIATKSNHGHLIAAAGAMEILTVIVAFQHGFLPGILNLDEPDPLLPENISLVKQHTYCPLHYALKNSFGMGGSAASLVLGNPDSTDGVFIC